MDLAAFAALMVATGGATAVFITLIFLLVSATIRWQVRGTLWTAAAAAVAFEAANLYSSAFGNGELVSIGTFLIRLIYLIIVAALLAYLVRTIASTTTAWTARHVAAHDVARALCRSFGNHVEGRRPDECAENRALVERLGKAAINVAWTEDERVMWKEEPSDSYGAVVASTLVERTFRRAIRDEQSRVVVLARTVPSAALPLSTNGFGHNSTCGRCSPGRSTASWSEAASSVSIASTVAR